MFRHTLLCHIRFLESRNLELVIEAEVTAKHLAHPRCLHWSPQWLWPLDGVGRYDAAKFDGRESFPPPHGPEGKARVLQHPPPRLYA